MEILKENLLGLKMKNSLLQNAVQIFFFFFTSFTMFNICNRFIKKVQN